MDMKDPESQTLQYGQVRAASRVPGAEVIKNTSEEFEEVPEEDGDEGKLLCKIQCSIILLCKQGWEGWEEASDDELEEEDGDWKDVKETSAIDVDISDEEAEEDKAEESQENQLPIECTKILTPQDYALLKKHRLEKEAEKLAGLSKKRRNVPET
jgi:hypothetical protein